MNEKRKSSPWHPVAITTVSPLIRFQLTGLYSVIVLK
jgi:hypothetical protein